MTETSVVVLTKKIVDAGEMADTLGSQKAQKLLILLDKSLTFEKTLSLTDTTTESEFLEMVPYERVVNRSYRLKKEQVVVAANSDMCDELISVAQEASVTLLGITPASIVQTLYPKMEINSPEVIKKAEQLVKYSLIYFEQEEKKGITLTLPHMKDRRFLLLISLFALLLIVLGVMIFVSFIGPKSTQKIALFSPIDNPILYAILKP